MNDAHKIAARKLRSLATALRADAGGREHTLAVSSLLIDEAVELERRADTLAGPPTITEPTEWGSVVLARDTAGSERMRWVRLDRRHWRAERNDYIATWDRLTDVEVLRVGVGGEYGPSLQQIRDLLFRSPTGYLTNDETLAAYKDLRKGLSALLSGDTTPDEAASPKWVDLFGIDPTHGDEPTPEQVEAEPVHYPGQNMAAIVALQEHLKPEQVEADLPSYDHAASRALTDLLHPEPTPEPVEAASAPEWARLDAANAEGDAIEALVWEVTEAIHRQGDGASMPLLATHLRDLAARVLEVQQPTPEDARARGYVDGFRDGQRYCVPMAEIRDVAESLRKSAGSAISTGGRLAYHIASGQVSALLPEEPTANPGRQVCLADCTLPRGHAGGCLR